MLQFNLNALFKARGIAHPRTFMINAGISPTTAGTILQGKIKTMRLDHMEILCKVLFCQPNDVLRWTPDTPDTVPVGHPIRKLNQSLAFGHLTQAIKTMPLDQLKKVSQFIKESESNK
jgi:DNA-binding Xre family transcriptional regulator